MHAESYVVQGLLMQGVAMRHCETQYMRGDLVMQTLFVQRLHEVEAASDVPGSSAPTGLPQKELLSWYFDKMVERCLLPSC